MAYVKKHRKVSIIMGIYNCAETLSEAINSLIAQSFSNWELILCDDGSTDESSEIAASYVDQFDNILLIYNESNLGLPATLNRCLEYAESEYIARMDGDDISLPERLEKEVSFLDIHKEFAFVSCSMVCFDENGTWGVQRNPERPQKKDFAFRSPFCHAPCMMRHSALNQVGNYSIDDRFRRGQDYWLWHKFYCAGYAGYNLQEPLYMMRDDREASKRRGASDSIIKRIKGRMTRASIQLEIMHNLGLPKFYDILALRPLLIALLPNFLYTVLHRIKIRHT